MQNKGKCWREQGFIPVTGNWDFNMDRGCGCQQGYARQANRRNACQSCEQEYVREREDNDCQCERCDDNRRVICCEQNTYIRDMDDCEYAAEQRCPRKDCDEQEDCPCQNTTRNRRCNDCDECNERRENTASSRSGCNECQKNTASSRGGCGECQKNTASSRGGCNERRENTASSRSGCNECQKNTASSRGGCGECNERRENTASSRGGCGECNERRENTASSRGGCGECNERRENTASGRRQGRGCACKNRHVGMVNMDMQEIDEIFESESALRAGTLFPELHKPLNGYCPCDSNCATCKQAAAFAAWEMRLYLNTHPHDEEALALFSRLCKEAGDENYATTFLTDECCTSAWNWVKNPWPWEYSCHCGDEKPDCGCRNGNA